MLDVSVCRVSLLSGLGHSTPHTPDMASLFDGTTLSEEGIRSLIKRGLPSEHRLVAWKYLLRLGGNATEFGRLVALGPHSGESRQAFGLE